MSLVSLQTRYDFEFVKRARDFAVVEHGKLLQEYNDKPFFVHLSDLQMVLARFGITDPIVLASAWLHDVVEDTGVTNDEIKSLFGVEVADIVDRVTNPTGGNRASRHAISYPKISQSSNATRVKLADRIANASSGKMIGMYVKEHGKFKSAIYRENCPQDIQNMWDYLDALISDNTPY